MSSKSSVFKGALLTLLAWLAYGIVEFVLTIVVPRVSAPESQLLSWQWPVIGILFAAYAVAGMLLGACGGALLAYLGSALPERFDAMASLTLVLALGANLISAWPLARSEQLALALAAGLAVVFTLAVGSNVWSRRVAFFANPWIVSLLLLSGPHLSRDTLRDHPAIVKTGVSLLAIAALLGVSALLHRMRAGAPIPSRRKVVSVTAVAAVIWILTQFSTPGFSVGADQPAPARASGKPNVVIITMDTVRADHLSVYGYERDTTPRLREFASGATVYRHGVSASDMTLPSHASMFTGLYPSWHGAYAAAPDFAYGRPLMPGAATLAGALQAAGYWTTAVVANHSFLQANMGLAQGFSLWKHNIAMHVSTSERPFYMREGARNLLSAVMSTTAFDGYFLRAADINRDAFAVLDQARNRGPFLLFLNYMDAHIPLVAPPPFRELFPGRDPAFRPATRHQDLTNMLNSGRGRLTESEKRHLISQYDGGIAYIDSELGRLFARLREMNLYDNTLIVITSDHGEAFGDHGLMQHGVGGVYQELAHVPFLVKFPGQQQPQQSDVPVSHVDILPTVLDAAGCPSPARVQGRKLAALDHAAREPVFSEAWALGDVRANPRLRGVRRAAFNGSSKLVMWSEGPPEFYDLAADPGELTNRYRADDPLAASLMARMTAWTATIPRQLPKPAKLDKSTMERIRSLGYTQ